MGEGGEFPFSIIWQCSPKQDSGNIDAELPVVPRLSPVADGRKREGGLPRRERRRQGVSDK